jgi:hypothetical protein
MGGQACFKHASERGVGSCWMKIRGEFEGKGGHVCSFWIAYVVDHIILRAYRSE